MSPGTTFERVYRELKRRLADGTLKPGQPIEPAQISAELAASITPIRDTLHRLVGERLVEAPNHNGFRVPRLSEAELRDLYLWNGQLVGLAIRHIHPDATCLDQPFLPEMDIAQEVAELFRRVAKGSGEQVRALEQLNDRLAPYRRVEPEVLENVVGELDAITNLFKAANRTQLNHALMRYHQRRAKAAPDIVATALASNSA